MDRYRAFIRAWFQCKSIDEVGLHLGMDRRAVADMAANLRRYGVRLPCKIRANRPGKWITIDWIELQALASELQGEETRRQAIADGARAADKYRSGEPNRPLPIYKCHNV